MPTTLFAKTHLRFTFTLTLSALGLLAGSPLLGEAPSNGPETLEEREVWYERFANLASEVPGGRVQARWLPDGDGFWYTEGAPGSAKIFRVDPAANEVVEIFDAKRVGKALAPHLKTEEAPKPGADGAAPAGLPFNSFELEDGSFAAGKATVRVTVSGQEFRLRWPEYRAEVVAAAPEPSEDAERRRPRLVKRGQSINDPDVYELPSPSGDWLAGVRDGDLWLRSAVAGREDVRLAEGGPEHVVWDVEASQWSPGGRWLVTRRIDRRGVHRVPLVSWLPVEESVRFIPFAKTGGKLARYEMHAFDVTSKRQVRFDLGDETDFAFHLVGFRADGSEFLLMRYDRRHKGLDLLAAKLEDGTVRTVVSERRETFVEALRLSVLWPTLFTPLADGERFLWLSERDGWKNAYLYHLDDGLIRQVTKGEFPLSYIAGVDEAEGKEEEAWVYYVAFGGERPYDQHLYRTRLLTEGDRLPGRQRLTEATGRHEVQMSPDLRFFLDAHSTVDRAAVTELRSAAGKKLRTLAKADTSALAELGWQRPEEFVVKAGDGETDLWGVLFKPRDFDPAKKYPVIDSIYNGPFFNWVPKTFLDPTGTRAQALAQLGFVVIVVDGRGTPERGKAFQDMAYTRFGQNEVPDHAAALRQLAATRPYMDLDRVGIFGGSWGGYMVVRALLTEPETFHVGVALNSVVNLEDHAAEAIEGYMGLPSDHPEAYARADNLPLAANLRGKLLLGHGTSDANATVSATLKMVDAFIQADRPVDLLLLPEQTHSPQGKARAYWDKARRRYFVEHLRP